MTEISLDLLTPQLKLWVRRAGLTATLAFVKARGGTPFKFPAAAAGSVLEEIVGLDAAEVFVGLYGTQTVNVPKADQILRQIRDAEIRRERAAGTSRSRLALKNGLTTRQIDNICAVTQTESLQCDLFQFGAEHG